LENTGENAVENKDRVNILLVDDQPGKLLSYEVMLAELGENLVAVTSAKDALAYLLKSEVAVILVDVCMPELDGFELAENGDYFHFRHPPD
jgi:CheY-like chemotaxis protein